MKKYLNYINENFEMIKPGEKGKLSIEKDDSEFNENWKLIVNLEKSWKQFINKSISLLDFNTIYATTLINNQKKIIETCGDVAWDSINPITVNELKNATNIEDSEKIYDKLYDIFDKYEILLNVGNENEMTEVNENSMEQQKYSVGDIVLINFFGEEKTARISKIPSKNSYLVQIEENTVFLPKEHSIKGEQIIDIISSNESPATTSDWNQPLKQKPSNDYVINGNGSPGVPAPGTTLN